MAPVITRPRERAWGHYSGRFIPVPVDSRVLEALHAVSNCVAVVLRPHYIGKEICEGGRKRMSEGWRKRMSEGGRRDGESG